MLALLLLMQAATPAEPLPADTPERFSILVQPCAADGQDLSGEEVVVCGKADGLAPRLPLPGDRVPDGPTPSNPDMTGAGALAASAPCHTRMGGCTVGFGPPIAPLVKGAVGLVKSAFAKHPDKTGRVPIPLDDDPPPGTDDKLLP